MEIPPSRMRFAPRNLVCCKGGYFGYCTLDLGPQKTPQFFFSVWALRGRKASKIGLKFLRCDFTRKLPKKHTKIFSARWRSKQGPRNLVCCSGGYSGRKYQSGALNFQAVTDPRSGARAEPAGSLAPVAGAEQLEQLEQKSKLALGTIKNGFRSSDLPPEGPKKEHRGNSSNLNKNQN